MKIKSSTFFAALVLMFANMNYTSAQMTLPPAFNNVLVAGGLIAPVTMTQAPAPDGRFFICQQTGALRVVKNGTLLTQPFITLNVNSSGERGLLGVALDPDFANNNYIYLCYTLASGSNNRVSRFTASHDTVVPGSELVLFNLDTLIAVDHGGGHLEFGPDSTLYVAAGENMRPLLAQDLDSYLGKIVRLNRDGSVPANNPFPGPNKRKYVWSYGMRNPFTFTFQPVTGRLFVDDVGNATWEEINDITLGGGNFGWPGCEGFCTDTTTQQPFYVYHHGTAADSLGCAITGGAFFNPDTTNYPANYINKYFYTDYCGNWINMVSLTNPPVRTNFATNIPNYAVGIRTGIDGNLYYLSRNNQGLYKIVYSPGLVPLILTQPQSQIVSLGTTVTFSVNVSGAPVIHYQWYKDSVLIPGAVDSTYIIPSAVLGDSGHYYVVVYNPYDTITSNIALLTVLSDTPPTAVIDTPLVNSYYTAGDTIHFFGHATDLEDGNLPDSAFSWLVEFHHLTHVHPGPAISNGIHSGTFIIPNNGETSAIVFYRLILIVHDSDGVVDSAYVDIYPKTSNIIFNSSPAGLPVILDGSPIPTPDTILNVEGMIRMFSAPASQMYYQTRVYFTHWSNGGTLTQTFTTPVNDTTWTVYYDSLLLSYNLGPDTIICMGNSINLDAGAAYNTYAWSDGSNGRYLNLFSAVEDTMTVAVTVTDLTGAGRDTLTVIFQNCVSVAAIEDRLLNIFPNPSKGEITIGELTENYFLSVFDMIGNVVISKDLVTAYRPKKINLKPGLYTIVITSANNEVIGRKNVSVIK